MQPGILLSHMVGWSWHEVQLEQSYSKWGKFIEQIPSLLEFHPSYFNWYQLTRIRVRVEVLGWSPSRYVCRFIRVFLIDLFRNYGATVVIQQFAKHLSSFKSIWCETSFDSKWGCWYGICSWRGFLKREFRCSSVERLHLLTTQYLGKH